MAFNKGLPKKPKEVKVATEQPVAAAPVITDDDLLSPAPIPETAEAVDESGKSENPAPPTAAPAGAFMTAADIAAIVHAATTAVNQAGNQAIADAISKALTQHMGPRRLTMAEIGEPKTPFNPTGRKRELKHEFYQNFAPIQERFVSDDEIEMLHQLVPGSYGTPDMPIAVVEKKRLNGKTRIFIIHPSGKDDRLRMKNYAPNFHQLLVRLVQEAKDQRAQKRAEARALLAED